ncbi:FAD-dependent oxidoreductase [Cyanobium sp. HWJ4-Hawea]|uniref:FAD-dependent oxidoreductase n=1 Tax=Cyanobium sp. HWJ4-Hawea TaxID=2823713 RepID=UPI0020CEDBC9|nr:FAD-dependent oxidoreductase [Cyanobium sp. HWJ4-Hawea]
MSVAAPAPAPAPSLADGDQVDVLIVGGGVCGTALLFELARYTDLGRIALVERYDQLAQVNSKATNNSQTIHCGDIETNYTLEKALRVKRTAEMIVHYADLLEPEIRNRCVFRTPKMVLGVGEQECGFLRERFNHFSPHFPAMELLEKGEIAEWEPQVALVNGALRPEPLLAIGIRRTYTAVDYEALSESFVEQAQAAVSQSVEGGKSVEGGADRQLRIQMGTKVELIEQEGDGFRVQIRPTKGGASRQLFARHVVVNAGAHSLLMAQQMGYGLEYSCLPVAGSFYFTPDLLKGKVYTVQNDKLPFAAIHGDPDVRAPGKTRFGPTALLLPQLERYKAASFWEFLKVLRLDWAVFSVFWQLFRIADIRNYIFKNLLFEVPWLRRFLFLADARKIVPGMALADLSFAEGYGGVRPQLINKTSRQLMLGEASIRPLPGLVFNVTPSPGGTCCLGNAATDVEAIAERLGCSFDQQALARELYGT